MNPVTGAIILRKQLDYEEKKVWKVKYSTSYPANICALLLINFKHFLFILQLMVTAADGGEPPFTTNKQISLYVEDINDNSPIFTFPSTNNSTLYATIKSDEPIARIKVNNDFEII